MKKFVLFTVILTFALCLCISASDKLSPALDVLVTWDGNVRKTTLAELLPEGFGPSSLGKEV